MVIGSGTYRRCSDCGDVCCIYAEGSCWSCNARQIEAFFQEQSLRESVVEKQEASVIEVAES